MKHFTIGELCASGTARAKGIDNTPPEAVRGNLEALVGNILDPLREAWGKPLAVTSGYRCPALNKLVGGVSNSQHITGHAADISTGNAVDNRRLYQLVQDLKLPYDQLIDEHGFSWIHVSYDPVRNRRQAFKL